MESLVVGTSLTREDWDAYVKDLGARSQTAAMPWWSWGAMLGALVLVPALLALYGRANATVWVAYLLGVGVIWAWWIVCSRVLRRYWRPDTDGSVLGASSVVLDAEGMRITRSNASSFTRWAAVRDITATDAHVYVWVDRIAAIIIPVRDLPSGVSAADVMSKVRAWMAAPPAPTGDEPAVAGIAAGPARLAATDTAAPQETTGKRSADWLRSLLRLLVLRPAGVHSLAARDGWLVTIAVIALAIRVAIDRLETGAGAQWFTGGFIVLGWYALGVLAIAWLVSRTTSPRQPYRAVLLLLSAFIPLALLVHWGLTSWAPGRLAEWVPLVLLLPGVLYLRRTLRALGAVRAVPATIVAGIAAVLFVGFTESTYMPARVLFPATDTTAEDMAAQWEQGDRLLFTQAQRIDRAVAALAPRQTGRANVFFVGFAGYAEQRVFAEEIAFANRIVGTRYGSADRALLLLNDRRNLESRPLATVSGLQHALRAVAGRMNVEEDVLFLTLSSHGSDDPELSVSNGILPLEQLTGEALKDALDGSGIRWRVVVISACHSGAFIDSLRDANTVVLTAAAAERTSFGCSDERDLTYFGEAFFRDALPGASTLRAAFEAARTAIAQREREEGISPSDPQAHFGAALEERWAEIDRTARLDGPKAASSRKKPT